MHPLLVAIGDQIKISICEAHDHCTSSLISKEYTPLLCNVVLEYICEPLLLKSILPHDLTSLLTVYQFTRKLTYCLLVAVA